MSLKDKLNRMKSHLSIEAAKPTPRFEPDIPYREQWQALQAKPFVFEDDYVMVREVRYPLEQRHGRYTFDQLYEVVEAWGETAINHPLSAAGSSAEDLLFFDTETTGLHGGVGNTIFLLGYSCVADGQVIVRQHFLASPNAEVSLYHSFLTDVKDLTHLVTFNGKAFDWPQVKTRHTLLRELVPDLPAFGHYDLLHGARRLWKHELESCRLSIIEQEKLYVHRHNDVPGYMAPLLYFDYLDSRDPASIAGVLQHNEIDVLSLITLYIHISTLLLDHERQASSHAERFAIARWYEAVGQEQQALSAYREIADSNHELKGKAMVALGLQYKKQKNWREALRIWSAFMEEFTHVPEEVYIETAKICEHQLKDFEKALYYTQKAYDDWKKRSQLLRHKARAEQSAYVKRIERLQARIEK